MTVNPAYEARPIQQRDRRQRVALVDLLDRVLARGVVISGDVTLSLADVDMVTISVRALITSAGGAAEAAGLRLPDRGRAR